MNRHKKGFIWVLEPSAVGKGIESTTRYRQKTTWRRTDSSDVVDPKRQKSGRKGGKAARRAANLKRSAKSDSRRARYARSLEDSYSESCSSSPFPAYGSMSPDLGLCHGGGLPNYLEPEITRSPYPGPSIYKFESTLPSASSSVDQTPSDSHGYSRNVISTEPEVARGSAFKFE